MSVPTLPTGHIDRPLTDISVAYIQDESHFVASRTFRGVNVDHMSDKYYVYNKADFLRRSMKKVADGIPPTPTGYRRSTDNYAADPWGDSMVVAWMEHRNADAPLDPEGDAAIFLMQKAMMEKEYQFATAAMADNVWANQVTGAASSPGTAEVLVWSDAASTPIEDIRTARRTVLLSTGYKPNIMTMGIEVYDVLAEHPDLIGRLDRGQTEGAAKVTRQQMAALFEVDEILVSEAVENTAGEGLTASNGFIVGKHCLLSYRPVAPSIRTPAAGYCFNWTGLDQQFADLGIGVYRFPVPRTPGSIDVQVYMCFDQKIVSSDLGYFFYNIVT